MTDFPKTIDKQTISALPKVTFPGRIFVIDTEDAARRAVDYLNTHVLVGVDTETRPSFRKGQSFKVALLQLSTADVCFLFRLNVIGLPDFLEDFLQNDVLKVGLSLKDDFLMLRRRNKKDARGELGGASGLCISFRHSGKEPAEDLRPAFRRKDFKEPAFVKLGGGCAFRRAEGLCGYRCLGVCAYLSVSGRIERKERNLEKSSLCISFI